MAEGEREQDARAVLLEQAWKNPAARPYLEEAFAKAFPNAEIPGRRERMTAVELQKKIDATSQVVDQRIAALEAKHVRERIHADLRQQGFTAEDIQAIEDLMEKEGIGTHQNAAVVYKSRQTVAQPRPSARSGWATGMQIPGRGPIGSGYFDGIMGQDGAGGDLWRRHTAETILNDFAQGPETKEAKRWLDDNYWPASPWAGKTSGPDIIATLKEALKQK